MDVSDALYFGKIKKRNAHHSTVIAASFGARVLQVDKGLIDARMSALGQKRTFCDAEAMSTLTPESGH
jgi:hypothetical protein